MKKNLLVCRSGGRTSEYMYKWLLENKRDEYNIIGIFANTGWEHHKTLEFVNNNDMENRERFGVEPVWVEAVVHIGRASCTHKIVTFETASRNREPMIEVFKKYGIANSAYPHCTRELKENPIHDYIKYIGWDKGQYYTALGIRIDEPKRILPQSAMPLRKKYSITTEQLMDVRKSFVLGYQDADNQRRFDLEPITLAAEMASERLLDMGFYDLESKLNRDFWDSFCYAVEKKFGDQNKVYPLVDWHPEQPDKLDILDWWEGHHFDLGIPEWLGNCVGCFRKSGRKCMKAYRDAPEQFINSMEIDMGHIGPNKINGAHVDEPRTMYRNYNTCQSIIKMFNDVDHGWLNKDDPDYMNEGCASSCEPFAN